VSDADHAALPKERDTASKVADFVEGADADLREDSPTRDVRKSLATWLRRLSDKWQELGYFFTTREFVFMDVSFLAECSDVELRALRLFTPWRFNIMESALCCLVTTIVAYIFVPDTPQNLPNHHPRASKILDWAFLAFWPFLTMLWAKITAWGSLKSRDHTSYNRWRATRAFLYLDGAYCLVPTTIFSFVTLAWPVSDVAQVFSLAWLAAWLTLSYFFFLWFSLFPRVLFTLNGYSGKAAWIRRLWNRKIQFGPFYKYCWAQLGAAGATGILLIVYVSWLTWLRKH
jgi:hypothetical protein